MLVVDLPHDHELYLLQHSIPVVVAEVHRMITVYHCLPSTGSVPTIIRCRRLVSMCINLGALWCNDSPVFQVLRLLLLADESFD